MTQSAVTIQITPVSAPSTPSWLGEVAAFAQVLSHLGVLNAIQEQVRFARARFGQYDTIDFVVVLIGYALSGERTLHAYYARLMPFADTTSLPNTVVAFLLARTGRASASVEEIFSSNSVNAALGIGLPLLFWSGVQSDHLLMVLDAPLMVALTLIALFCVSKQHVSRLVGFLLLLIYIGWIIIHVVL